VGREGAAVQLSGSLSDQLSGLFKLGNRERRLILVAAISAGFAAIFGTPLAATVFALEIAASSNFRDRQQTIAEILSNSLVYSIFCLFCAQLANLWSASF